MTKCLLQWIEPLLKRSSASEECSLTLTQLIHKTLDNRSQVIPDNVKKEIGYFTADKEIELKV